MLHFSYTARNSKGELVNGFIDSVNKENATALLRKDGLIVISIELGEEDALHKFLHGLKFMMDRPSLTDLIIFSKQMHTLTRAGVPIIQSIKIVANTCKNEMLTKSLEEMAIKLESGQNLSVSIQKYRDVFPTLMEALINVGENTGTLDEVFKQLATHLERESETRKQLKSATRYPMMVIITIGVAIGIINLFVIPAFARFFDKFDAELPLPTKILIATSNFTVQYWYVVIIVILTAVATWMSYLRTSQGRMFWDRWKIRIPIIGSIIERALLSRFARSFALTSRTGVPLLDAIAIIAKTTDNVYVGKKILTMRSSIEHGESLAVASKTCGMFSPLVLQMIAIGEETGEVDRLLDEVADFYESELDYDLKTLSESIEPILIGVVAVMVLILALGIFLPMWDISKVALGQ